MKLPLFTDSPNCHLRRDRVGGANCNGCRSSEAFRRLLLNAYSLPGDDINFDCPHGVPWIGNRPDGLTAPPTDPRILENIRRQHGPCKGCGD